MHDPFALLDIDRNADERAIKRAYAAKLKTTRPDEDPEAFQRLNEAYRQALDEAAWRREAYGDDAADSESDDGVGDDPAHGDPPRVDDDPATGEWEWADSHHPRGMPALPSPQALHRMPVFARAGDPGDAEARGTGFDFEAFFEALEIQIHGTYPSDFGLWLERHPALHDARTKQGIRLRLPHFLAQRPTLPEGHVDALTACFDLGRNDTTTADPEPAGFDLDRFLETLEVVIHRTKPAPFRHWLDQHPALYDVSLKQSIAADVVHFMELRPTLPRGHVEALLSFFGLDRVNDDDPFLQQRVQRIMHHVAGPEPVKTSERSEGGGFPIFWLIFVIIMLARCAGATSG